MQRCSWGLTINCTANVIQQKWGAQEIEAFLSHLAQVGNVSASTQNQALNALLFLFRNGLHLELKAPVHALRARQSQHLPTMLSKNEVSCLKAVPNCIITERVSIMAKKIQITNNIRKLRFFASEMTHQELAEKAGVSRQTIIAVEAGKYSPSLELAFRIADAFSVKIGDVFDYEILVST
jgi:putative transcriptional regulator